MYIQALQKLGLGNIPRDTKIWSNSNSGVAYDGKFFKFDTTYVWPRPISNPHHTEGRLKGVTTFNGDDGLASVTKHLGL